MALTQPPICVETTAEVEDQRKKIEAADQETKASVEARRITIKREIALKAGAAIAVAVAGRCRQAELRAAQGGAAAQGMTAGTDVHRARKPADFAQELVALCQALCWL